MSFESKEDPLTNQAFSLNFTHDDFSLIEGDSIFKLAARAHMENESGQNCSDISVKYQVLSKETAFVGEIKQFEKVIGEVKEV